MVLRGQWPLFSQEFFVSVAAPVVAASRKNPSGTCVSWEDKSVFTFSMDPERLWGLPHVRMLYKGRLKLRGLAI